MIKIAIAGVAGRMGRAILKIAAQDKNCRVAGGLEQASSPLIGEDLGSLTGTAPLNVKVTANISEALSNADVLIDFTHFSAAEANLKAVLQKKIGYVLGTTGLNETVLGSLKTAAKTIPVVQSPNMSIGVNLLFKLSEMTAKVLNEDYDIEIVEAHHRMKKDAPSGTALKLLEVMARARKRDRKKDVVYGREGETGARPRGQIGVLALRGGDVIGDHTVSFLAEGERVELAHRATSRDAFAQGAVRAAKFVVMQKPGLYNMAQVLGLE